tara:strand:- start:1363 stop:1902 length:540 start_codon:yes stop_codon:yes gene_type:complete
MKKIISFLILMSLFNNCNKNDFLDTELKLETDKKSYYINEKIELKIIVSTNENKKKIRFEKDFNNIDINFNTPEIQNSFHQVLKQKFIEFPSSSEKKKIDITEIEITKNKPFEKKFIGTISELKNNIVIEIKELKIKETISKTVLIKNPRVIIEGNCRNIFEIDENVFIPKEIEILIEK